MSDMSMPIAEGGVGRLFNQIASILRRTSDLSVLCQGAVDQIGPFFDLDRCVCFLYKEDQQIITASAEYVKEPLAAVGRLSYQLLPYHEWHRLLQDGRPVPLSHIKAQPANSDLPEFGQYITDSQSRELVAFPFISRTKTFLGCLVVSHCQSNKSFSDEFMETVEALAEELSIGIDRLLLLGEKELEGEVFQRLPLPFVVLESGSYRIIQTNKACRNLLAGSSGQLTGLSFLDLFADSDSKRLRETPDRLTSADKIITLTELMARSTDGEPLLLDASVSRFSLKGDPGLIVVLMPKAVHDDPLGELVDGQVDAATTARMQEMVSTLSRQLNWERLTRQLIQIAHSTLDQDGVLQSVVDALGRALNLSRCLIVRTIGPSAPSVTHEWVDPSISPLGLGRTVRFPAGAARLFRSGPSVLNDLSVAAGSGGLDDADRNDLLDMGVMAMAGAPIASHGKGPGLVLVAQCQNPRNWLAEELELLNTVCQQLVRSLNHGQHYSQLKDQLFNVNLVGNLSQQLTNALELANKLHKTDRTAAGKGKPETAPPLSGREMEVLKLIATGLSNREIAQHLFLTESTVELHASRIRKKLKLRSRTALVKYACDNNLV